jgi:hypothetical protein
MRITGIAFLILLCVLLAACSGQPGGVLVIPLTPNAKHAGKTYSEWSVEWWKWALGQPVNTNPLFDLNGQFAANGQTGNVWFLGATFGDPNVVARTINLPEGTSVFFPLMNFEEDSAFAPDMSDSEMQTEISNFAGQVISLSLVVDGVSMPDLHLLRAKSPAPFSVDVPASDSVYAHFGVDAGASVATVVSDGYWAFIDPLPVGSHTIQFGGVQTTGAENATISATYNINVFSAD